MTELIISNTRQHAAFWSAVMVLTILGNAGRAQAQSTPVIAGYRDFYFGKSVNSTPTGEKPQSKLWWNDGIWWGSLWNRAQNAHTIHRFELATQSWTNTGVAIDERQDAKADALWDGQRLYVVSQIFTHSPGPTTSANSGRLYRYSYNPTSQSYSLDAGFPVTVNSSISETLVLAKDSAGKLWVTWTEGGKVKVNRSLGNDLTWGTPFDLPGQGTDIKNDDISSILAFGGNKIGILWSNQNDKTTYFAVHLDGNAGEVWEPKEPALADPTLGGVSYDHINLKPSCDDDGNVYAVTKTNLTKSGLPLDYLLKRNAAGSWSRYIVSTVDEGYVRPILLIDGQHDSLYVFAMSEVTGDRIIYMKRSGLDNIMFAPGLGTPFIQSATDTMLINPTSTKQCLNSATGLLVLTADQHTRYYFHNYLDLSGGVAQFALTVNTAGPGNVTLNPPGGVYNAGTVVTLTATPDSGYQFSGWSGDLSGLSTSENITMDDNKTVTATFTVLNQIAHEETQAGGSSNVTTVTTSGSLTAADGHLYLAAISTRPKRNVTTVSGLGLTWALVKAQCAGRSTTGVEVWKAQGIPSGNQVVTATLESAATNAVIAVSRYSGVHATHPTGNEISGNANGSNGACSGGTDGNFYSFELITTADSTFVYGAVALRGVTHTPGTGYTERAEVKQAAGGNAAAVAVEDKSIVTASTIAVEGALSGDMDWAMVAVEIKPQGTATMQYTLTVDTTGPGTVTLDPPGGVYDAGTVVTLTATPDAGYQFNGWSGDLSGTNDPETITLDGDKSVTATFTALTQIVHEETQTGGSSNLTTVTTLASVAGVSGHLYLAAISTRPKKNVTTVSGLGLSWSLVKVQCAGRSTTGIEVWKAQGTPGSNEAVTATLESAATNAVIAVSRYSGVHATQPVGNVISGNTNGLNGACSGGTDGNSYSFDLTTTAEGALVYGAVAIRGVTHTPGPGYTERAEIKQALNNNPAALAVADKNFTLPATVAVEGTLSGVMDWAMMAVEIKPQSTLGRRLAHSAEESASPSTFQLEQNYPNPFNPETEINFILPVAGKVTVKVYDETGQIVRALANAEMAAGRYALHWNGRNQFGRPVATGVYFCRMVVQGEDGSALFAQTRRMTLLK